jgi:hypothetical protein
MPGVRVTIHAENPMQTTPRIPEPDVARAYLHLVHRAILFLRARSHDLPREQIFDLADALHNVPHFLSASLWSDEDFRRRYLEPYDRKWASSPTSPSLVAFLEEDRPE